LDKDNCTYNQNQIKSWLLKAILVFGIFSFSGFSIPTQAAISESIQTELTESRVRKPAYQLKKQTKKDRKIIHPSLFSDGRPFNSSTILNDNLVLKTQFESYQNRIQLYSIALIKIPFKIPSSTFEDDTPLYIS